MKIVLKVFEFNFNYNNYYCKINNSYGIILMKCVNDNDIINHIKEITNNVTSVNYDKTYVYKC